MKAIIITLLIVSALCIAAHHEMKKETRLTRQEVAEMIQKIEEREAREQAMRKEKRKRKMTQMVPQAKTTDSPFVQKTAQELKEEFGWTRASTHDALQKLRELSIDEVRLLNHHLLRRHTYTDSHNQRCLFVASDLILLESEPLTILDDDDIRYGSWLHRANFAFQSLLRKDPEAAKNFFQKIPQDLLDSSKSPYSKIYTQMIAHLFAHDPKEAIKLYQIQKDAIRNLPEEGFRAQLTSMDQVMPYAELLRSHSMTDPKIAGLLKWACKEVDRLGGLEALGRFSKTWAGPEKSNEEQWELFTALRNPITNSERTNEFIDIISREKLSNRHSLLTGLAQDWSKIDLQGASQWIKEQESSPDRDVMIEALMHGLPWANHAATEQWIPLLHNEATKLKYLEEIEKREAPYQN